MEEKKNYNNIEIVKEGGLQCDNTTCDYTEDTLFKDYEACIGKPCPKCGENLLTEDDYHRAVVLRETINFVNSMSPENLDSINNLLTEEERSELLKNMDFFKDAEGIDDLSEDTKIIKTTVTTHKEVKAIKVEKADAED